ncbi:MAG: hypothetical protein IJR82_01750 [Bacilli bacterium]|nr:hypothetical protein [Bacilli bacterium]
MYMLNVKDIVNKIDGLLVESEQDSYVVGNGILLGLHLGFDETKIAGSKRR